MTDLSKRVLRRIARFYERVNQNVPRFCTKLMMYNFDDDLICTLLYIYRGLLKKYEHNLWGLEDEYFAIFNYVIFSYLNCFLSEQNHGNSHLFDYFHDFNGEMFLSNGTTTGKMRKRIRDISRKIQKVLLSSSPVIENSIRVRNRKSVKCYLNFFRKGEKIVSSKKGENRDVETAWKKHYSYEKHSRDDQFGHIQNGNYWDGYTTRGERGERENGEHMNYPNESNFSHMSSDSLNTLFSYGDNQLEENSEYAMYRNRNVLNSVLKDNKQILSIIAWTELGKKRLVKKLQNLYAHIYYWKYLTELNLNCRRKSDMYEKNIYVDIYKNVYTLYERMQRMYRNNFEIMNQKREELSITHNNEMENLIDENKTNQKNQNSQEKINDMVFKHIAEKKALNRHIRHELNIMKHINLREYKKNIFYIFNIIEKKKNALSLPPLPIDEEKQDVNLPYHTNEKKQNVIYSQPQDGKHFAYIINNFYFFYLYKLVKSKINVLHYFHFYMKNSIYDTMHISVIFSVGEIYNLFEYHNKNNLSFKKKFFHLLKSMYKTHYAYHYGENTETFKQMSNGFISTKGDTKRETLSGEAYHSDERKTRKDKEKEEKLPREMYTPIHTSTMTGKEKGNAVPNRVYQCSEYFDENGYLKSRNLKDEKIFYKKCYSSTHKFLRENSIRFLKKITPSSVNTCVHLNKISIKEKKLNALILYIHEDVSNYAKENVYKNLLNISLTETDFIFPNLKEQLTMCIIPKKGNSFSFTKTKRDNNVGEESCAKCSYRVNRHKYYHDTCGNIIITRHKNLKIAMNDRPEKFRDSRGGESVKEQPIGGTNGNNDCSGSSNGSRSKNSEMGKTNTSENCERNCQFYRNFLKKKKKKNVYIDIIFHVIIPKKVNRNSFKIILLSLLKILDLCKIYGISSINFSLPYIHNIVHKNKRSVIYSFMYSLIFTMLNYVNTSQPFTNSVNIFHFIFPNLMFYEKGKYCTVETNDKPQHPKNGKNDSYTDSCSYPKKNEAITMVEILEQKKTFPYVSEAFNNSGHCDRLTTIMSFINKVIDGLIEKYVLIERV
ncbi:conserved Plasmodium protein, unknown function [Plasmodium ovale curtisi]|uniref:Uncharacterized protein n=1 Tax=Plasmodium ovale curtisi TaxID=864141 RepID=A0A1A8WUC5_PLAOA|nr:conserved Plasmodium protein, unknown function [Plasmodium ovale curtisi]